MSKGLVLGKFLPLHKGHEFLLNYAQKHSDQLYIVVDNVSEDVIPVSLRAKWIKKLYPKACVLTLPKQLPQYPEEAPDFWQQWQEALLDLLPEKIDYVFASETYGEKLAQVLDAEFTMVDLERSTVDISATKIRENPFRYWEFISDEAKPHYVKKVCVFGPESTGKTTLTQKLSEHFDTIWVEEYARQVIESKNGDIQFDDMTEIAIGQKNLYNDGIKKANKLLFCDTDAITSKIWSLQLFNKYPAILDDIIKNTDYDLYLLLDVDVPWVKDTVRYFPENRKEFFDICESELKKYGKTYKIINGNFDERFENAVKIVEEFFYARNK